MSKDAVRNLFKKVDCDGQGGISITELGRFLRQFPIDPTKPYTDQDVAQYFVKCDKDESGSLDFDEFYTLFEAKDNKDLSDADLKKLFSQYDKDGSGYIDVNEMELLLVKCKGYKPELAKKDLDKFDKDGDGRINYKEFSDSIRKK